MRITYCKTAYVTVGDRLLDDIDTVLSSWATGEGNVCITRENINEFISDYEESSSTTENETRVYNLFKELDSELESGVGDVIFSN